MGILSGSPMILNACMEKSWQLDGLLSGSHLSDLSIIQRWLYGELKSVLHSCSCLTVRGVLIEVVASVGGSESRLFTVVVGWNVTYLYAVPICITFLFEKRIVQVVLHDVHVIICSYASTVVFPLDLVRRRMQLEGAGGRARVYKTGIFGTLSHITKTEGFRGLYRGILPEYYKVVPSVGIVFMTYEKLKQVFSCIPES
ncbi:hypothetical protein Leryth_008614 [Lithospermum erythrorhizon]|nr:hypothetical protein Leryth_008614 [Lithospermum erythrorhizon]